MATTNSRWRMLPLLCFLSLSPNESRAEGIPEPSLILYGTIRNTAVYNARVTSGRLLWVLRRQDTGRSVTNTASLSNVAGQFSYVLVVPCESLVVGPVSSNALELLVSSVTYDRSQVFADGRLATFAIPSQSSIALSSRNRGSIERVDLTINAPCTDIDGLGLCDDWENQFFGSPGHRPDLDDDGDGMTNLQEFIAGTNPSDENSFFHFIQYKAHPEGGFQVQWNSIEGRSYALLRSTNLRPGSFTMVRSNIVATAPINIFVDTNAIPPGPWFYNLFIQP